MALLTDAPRRPYTEILDRVSIEEGTRAYAALRAEIIAAGVLERSYLYYAILIPHIPLAAAVVPLAIVAIRRALRGDFEKHRALARVLWPIWIFVSVSGVTIYWMLYRL